MVLGRSLTFGYLDPYRSSVDQESNMHMSQGQNSFKGEHIGLVYCPCYKAFSLYIRSFDHGSHTIRNVGPTTSLHLL